MPAIYGGIAGIELMQEIGIAATREHVTALTERLIAVCQQHRHATPAALAMPVGLRVAALPPSDRSRYCLRPSRACPSWAAAYRFADRLATGMAPTAMPTKIDIGADLVGDTGLEPMTSTV